jgi:hypothetical protein
MYVNFANNGHVVSSFAVEWNGGETDRTKEISEGQTASIDLSRYAAVLPNGTSCWARAYPVAAPNHDSGDNFNVQSGGTAYYELRGSAVRLYFEYHGIRADAEGDAEADAPSEPVQPSA